MPRNPIPRPAILPIGPSVAYIPLTRCQYALVDSDDVERLTFRRWTAHWDPKGRCFYAKCKSGNMHRLIHGTAKNTCCDHKNGNTLDNRKVNLRQATRSQNGANRPAQADNTTGYKGVSWHVKTKRFRAKITHMKRQIHIGTFTDPESAYRAYAEVALKLQGEFARLR